jgi:hypothetical protein
MNSTYYDAVINPVVCPKFIGVKKRYEFVRQCRSAAASTSMEIVRACCASHSIVSIPNSQSQMTRTGLTWVLRFAKRGPTWTKVVWMQP